ncbi:FliM/FliN family flagellar motor C-terminal domain-containing protein [Wenxinia marina]|uniref:Flagellar motor switch protein n=1 Tax=Wenxinia marina DSM 24838 TaxID=1123501 RepID=A0A0D0Q8W3_9RHOB|nr:FliM/FliN family flagellar motor C-terminal domain-containing protein [Wenxinia marina]KIQ68812.1 Flagellar motor switch protein [Wenxinia marina DSM 24838]GGL65059.1 hypothetical protein GCM10011392_19600 [Wenxinia marina]
MAADGSHPVLRRMAGIAAAPSGPEPPVTPARALRRAATRAGAALDLALTVASIADERRTLDEVLAGLNEADLLLGLDRDGAERGLAVIDLDLRDALVEVQTLGRLSDRPRPEDAPRRAVTAADAALGLPFLDGLLRGLAAAGTGTDLPDWVAGASGGERHASRRAIGATLPAGDYRVVTLALDLEGGRAGQLTLILPPSRPLSATSPPAHGRDWADAFRGSVEEATAVLTAVLARHRIPLSEAEALRPGLVLPLPGVTVGSVRLEAPPGRVLATARLGQVAGLRAVRLEMPAPAELSDRRAPARGAPGVLDGEVGHGRAADPWAGTDGLTLDAPAAIPPMDLTGAPDLSPPSPDPHDDPGPPDPHDAAPADGGGGAGRDIDAEAGNTPIGDALSWPADPAGPDAAARLDPRGGEWEHHGSGPQGDAEDDLPRCATDLMTDPDHAPAVDSTGGSIDGASPAGPAPPGAGRAGAAPVDGTSPSGAVAAPATARFALAGDDATDFDAEGQQAPDGAIARGLDVSRLRLDEEAE